MILKWSDYLQLHPANQDYNQNLDAIQNLIKNEESDETNFRNLTDNKSLLCLTKSNLDNELQATFYHTLLRLSIADQNPKQFALTGFGSRASTVQLNPEEYLRQTSQNKKLPKIEHLIRCNTIEEVLALATPEARKVEYHAVLSPWLNETIFEKDDMSPQNTLLKFIEKIREMKEPEENKETNETEDEPEGTEANNANEEEKRDSVSTSEESDEVEILDNDLTENEAAALKSNFGKIIEFLFATVKQPTAIKASNLRLCTKRSSMA